MKKNDDQSGAGAHSFSPSSPHRRQRIKEPTRQTRQARQERSVRDERTQPVAASPLVQRWLAAMEAVVTELMHRPDLPVLSWKIDLVGSQLTATYLPTLLDELSLLGEAGPAYAPDTIEPVLKLWAGELGLRQRASVDPRMIEFEGIVNGRHIAVRGMAAPERLPADDPDNPAHDPESFTGQPH